MFYPFENAPEIDPWEFPGLCNYHKTWRQYGTSHHSANICPLHNIQHAPRFDSSFSTEVQQIMLILFQKSHQLNKITLPTMTFCRRNTHHWWWCRWFVAVPMESKEKKSTAVCRSTLAFALTERPFGCCWWNALFGFSSQCEWPTLTDISFGNKINGIHTVSFNKGEPWQCSMLNRNEIYQANFMVFLLRFFFFIFLMSSFFGGQIQTFEKLFKDLLWFHFISVEPTSSG